MFDFKNASETELNRKFAQIAHESGDDQFFTKKELKYLPNTLMANEQVLAFSSGFMDGNTWLIALTDKRVIFLDKGFFYGLKQTAIPITPGFPIWPWYSTVRTSRRALISGAPT